jgi:hypothetical protein
LPELLDVALASHECASLTPVSNASKVPDRRAGTDSDDPVIVHARRALGSHSATTLGQNYRLAG